MYLIQLLLPINDNQGNPFPSSHYSNIRKQLVDQFGGLTAYNRAPANGVWKDNENTFEQDEIVVFEVMVETLEASWWKQYRETLESLFSQDKLVIRLQEIRLL